MIQLIKNIPDIIIISLGVIFGSKLELLCKTTISGHIKKMKKQKNSKAETNIKNYLIIRRVMQIVVSGNGIV